MQIIVDYTMMFTFVACALLFNKRTAKHANVINELRRELAKSKDKNGELQDALAESEHKRKKAEDRANAYKALLSKEQRQDEEALEIANTANRSR